MATVEQPKPQANSRPTRAQPAAVIRYIPGQDGDPDRWRRLLPAWIISFVIHICLVLLFLVLNFKLNAETIIPEDQVIMTCVAMGYPDDSFAANAVRSDRTAHDDFVRYVGFAD